MEDPERLYQIFPEYFAEKINNRSGLHGIYPEILFLQCYPNQFARGFLIVDEYGGRCAPAEGFDSQLSGAGKKIKYLCARKVKVNDTEHCFLDTIRCGAGS